MGSVFSCDAAGFGSAGGPGNCTVLTDLFVPHLCHIEMSDGRAIWFQTRSNNGVNLNLVASAAVTGG
jgi:hypothetical protein